VFTDCSPAKKVFGFLRAQDEKVFINLLEILDFDKKTGVNRTEPVRSFRGNHDFRIAVISGRNTPDYFGIHGTVVHRVGDGHNRSGHGGIMQGV
jgi:hypothetical protein